MHLWQYLSNCLPLLQRAVSSGSELVLQPFTGYNSPPIAFSRSWQVLGPFSIGTRGTITSLDFQAPWGADPLEYEGGFRALHYNPDAWFRGSLVPGADVPWTVFNAKSISHTGHGSEVTLQIQFGEVDWQFLQKVYGWSALQYQAWARGHIDVAGDTAEDVVLYTESILEFWLDGVPHFGGDFYGYRRAPLVLHLDPGRHQLDVRLVRDVRAMGGAALPSIEVHLEVRRAAEPLEFSDSGLLISDVVEGRLAGSLGSATLRNNGKATLEIVSIRELNVSTRVSAYGFQDAAKFTLRKAARLVSGQTRPVAFEVELQKSKVSSLDIVIEYRAVGEVGFLFSLHTSAKVRHRSIYEPHMTTFLHPGGIVSYAMLRPPAWNASCPQHISDAPILLQLHGAGVEASGDMLTHSLDAVPPLCAWTLFPTGTTTWSGDDWHTWGFADVEAAIEHIPAWMKATGWKGVGVDPSRWLVAGHSNGGQGTWYALTHRPDKIIGAAPVSGYSSIQNYVPYQLWQTADPSKTAVLQASLNSFRHEMLVDNAKGIPILQQHGVYDDNVPTYHSRLMHALLYRAGINTTYSEVFKGHWFDEVMETYALQEFYRTHLHRIQSGPHVLANFTVVVANPADMGPKEGLRVLHLVDPGQYGRIETSTEPLRESCHFKTSNIMAFETNMRYAACQVIKIDGKTIPSGWAPRFSRDYTGEWKVHVALPHVRRKGPQLGNIDAILRTVGKFAICHSGSNASNVALQVSRNLVQYYAADAEILEENELAEAFGGSEGNRISIFTGVNVPEPEEENYPLQVNERGDVWIRDDSGNRRSYGQEEAGAAIFVRPLHSERLELVIWGANADSTAMAARLMPTLTGVGQPDFVILSKSCRWKGVDGVVAMGFFDAQWNVTRSSFFS
ncbi:hypothetical protein NA57DRAFT_41840 [Rhizodiscina lignyota]|uniref:Peptidase S9 prolyl oligopeptidase catalytic domain-containing protein n=1 Tax=Rhizodiscina lignyota TaxID=1504668 RepID=A0A9P4IFW9_9PEZI|nr:hypothetical protein NA57DRAFT_41840 [Rhizodiscina lignyota]